MGSYYKSKLKNQIRVHEWKMVEMAGTAPACKEVLSACVPIYNLILGTFSYRERAKSRKKLLSYTYTVTPEEILAGKTDNTTLPYQFREMKVVAGHSALIPLGKATLLCD